MKTVCFLCKEKSQEKDEKDFTTSENHIICPACGNKVWKSSSLGKTIGEKSSNVDTENVPTLPLVDENATCPDCKTVCEKNKDGYNIIDCRCGKSFCYKCKTSHFKCTCGLSGPPPAFLLVSGLLFLAIVIGYEGVIKNEESKKIQFAFLEKCNLTWPTTDDNCILYENELHQQVKQELNANFIIKPKLNQDELDFILERAKFKSDWNEWETAFVSKQYANMKKKWMQLKHICPLSKSHFVLYCEYWNSRFGLEE